jgi:hypothetical protein
MPAPDSGAPLPFNYLLMKEIAGTGRARRWKVREIPDCRDFLHFEAGKAYMLNFLRIMLL